MSCSSVRETEEHEPLAKALEQGDSQITANLAPRCTNASSPRPFRADSVVRSPTRRFFCTPISGHIPILSSLKHWQAEAKAIGFEPWPKPPARTDDGRLQWPTWSSSVRGLAECPIPAPVGVRTISGRGGNHKQRATTRGPTRISARPGAFARWINLMIFPASRSCFVIESASGNDWQGFRFLDHRQRSGRSTSSA